MSTDTSIEIDLDLIERAFEEDAVLEDKTTIGCINLNTQATATLLLKQEGVIAGLLFAEAVFMQRDPTLQIELLARDGQRLPAGTKLGIITGSAHSLLSAERTALNLLQHLSGIATFTSACTAAVKGTRCKILDTRKTLPAYRSLQKYAVRMGGGTNHRLHLADRILIKNNHLALTPLATCIAHCRARFSKEPIQLEVATYEQFCEAQSLHVEAILLDNMTPSEVLRCVQANKTGAFLEASGGMNLSNLRSYAETGIDAISIGALTHSAPALDISLRLK